LRTCRDSGLCSAALAVGGRKFVLLMRSTKLIINGGDCTFWFKSMVDNKQSTNVCWYLSVIWQDAVANYQLTMMIVHWAIDDVKAMVDDDSIIDAPWPVAKQNLWR
jgi:hypothetical protein